VPTKYNTLIATIQLKISFQGIFSFFLTSLLEHLKKIAYNIKQMMVGKEGII
jgi:hypothetical protein